jgi:alpha-galactosidase
VTSERIVIDAGATSLALAAADDGRLHQVGLGEASALAEPSPFPVGLHPLALPTHGEEALREPALRVTHADGTTGTRLVVRGHEAAEHEGGAQHRIELADRVQPLRVDLCLRGWPELGVLEQWVEVVNEGPEPVLLHQAAALALALGGTDRHLTRWSGGWANEWTETTTPLASGTLTLAGRGGVRSSLTLPPIVVVSLDGPPREDEGEVIACTVVWGGDARFDAEVALHGHGRLIAGHQHRGAERVLDPGERFATPAALVVRSAAGVGPTSRALHRWVRRHVVRDGQRPRAIAFNNWEAQGFALSTEAVGEVVDGAAAIGAELFLLDDGWFGASHPRDDDTQGLGDWVVDRAKFPDGLAPVIERTLAAGLRFGLWVEPEMVNPGSSLYEAHPDWVIAEPGRERREERQQLVLDLCRPEVAAFVVDTIDRVLAEHPGTSYLKWDANRDIFEAGSTALPADRQSHLAIDRVRATLDVMAEVARRHPDVELMLCASGGGRSDLADLAHFHELWTSDNTDPVDRVRIQWGASHLLPALVLGAHVTRWGLKPVAFSCAVAMSARFGFDIDPRSFTPEEREAAAQAVQAYRRIRPLVQFGELHRLVSPVGSSFGAVAFLHGPDVPAAEGPAAGTADGAPRPDDRAVVFAYRLDDGAGEDPPAIGVPGLEPDAVYEVDDVTPGRVAEETGDTDGTRSWTGAQLADGALTWPAGPAPAARVWTLRIAR